MKTRSYLLSFIFLFTVYLIFSDVMNNNAQSHTAGAPATRTGSPGDGNLTCTSCHAGPAASVQAGWITSDIPASGYVPGTTYSITATATRAGHVKFGFEISPQNVAGTLLGTLISVNSETQLIGPSKYITHTSSGANGPSGTKAWTFNWTAPSTGTGNVTFYGAFLVTNNANSSGSDTTYTSTLAVSECSLPNLPDPVSGNQIVCPGSTNNYSVPSDANVNDYTWTIPGGWSGSSTSNSITVTTDSSAGTISVIANNDCGSSSAATLAVSMSQLSVTTTQTHVNCKDGNDGSATAFPVNGTSPYQYSWSPSGDNMITADSLAAGTYTVTVTDSNNCMATSSAVITEPVIAVSLSSVHTNVNCHGDSTGSITVTAGGGTPGYSYSWSPAGGSLAMASNLVAGTYTVTVTDMNGCTDTSISTIMQPGSAISLSSTHTMISCHGDSTGTATVTAGGGSPGYQYSWSPSGGNSAIASNLVAGTYVVTVTDTNNCTDTSIQTIAEPAPLSVLSSSMNASCNQSNGTVTAIASGGTPGYSYTWNTTPVQTTSTAMNLAAGTYSVTVADTNGCSSAFIATINNNSTLAVMVDTIIPINCFGGNTGSATVSITGGIPAYSYSWFPSGGDSATASNLFAGTYSVEVSDSAGCISTALVHVTEPAKLIANAGPAVSICEGDSSAVGGTPFISGGTFPYFYSWSPPAGLSSTTDSIPFASPVLTAVYTLSVMDNKGCMADSSVTVTVHPLPAIPIITQQADTLWSTPATGYQWLLEGIEIPSATGQVLVPVADGNYAVVITDVNGCSIASAPYFFSGIGIEKHQRTIDFRIYPNPYHDKTTITYTIFFPGQVLIEVYGLTGVKIATLVNRQQDNGIYKLSFSAAELNYSPAVYVLRMNINGAIHKEFLMEVQ